MTYMLPVIVKNFFSKRETRLYPREERELPENTRGSIVFKNENCTFCTLCAKRCPADAIKVDRANKTLTFDPFRCIVCNACVEGCARNDIELQLHWRIPQSDKPIEVHKGHIEDK